MSLPKRKDLQTRTAGEKAQFPDEFITRSQVIPGENIRIDYLNNHDIRISALTGAGSDRTRAIGRVLTGEVDVKNFLALTDAEGTNSYQYLFVGKEDPNTDLTGLSGYASKYGTMYYYDVHHNWNLPDKGSFLYSVVDERELSGASVYLSLNSNIKVVGIDANTIRFWATDIFKVDEPADWAANADTDIIKSPGAPLGAFESAPGPYRFALMEIIN